VDENGKDHRHAVAGVVAVAVGVGAAAATEGMTGIVVGIGAEIVTESVRLMRAIILVAVVAVEDAVAVMVASLIVEALVGMVVPVRPDLLGHPALPAMAVVRLHLTLKVLHHLRLLMSVLNRPRRSSSCSQH